MDERHPAPNPWTRVEVPPDLERIPSMLKREELQYLIWVTAETLEGIGAVVDLGPWLGSSSAALAEGLRRAGHGDVVVHSFDRFVWNPDYMEQYAPENLPRGADFLPLFRRHTAAYAKRIVAEKMDLFAGRWNGEPIEVLFVDAAKDWTLLDAIFTVFGDSLVPGRSRVILQDFRCYYTYWLPLVFDSRPDLWQQLDAVDDGGTTTFRPLKPLYGPGGLQRGYTDDCFPLPSAMHVLRRRIAASGRHAANKFRVVLYRLACVHGDDELAVATEKELLDAVDPSKRDMWLGELRDAAAYTARERVAKAWAAIEGGDLAAAGRLVAPASMRARSDVLTVQGRLAQLERRLADAVASYQAAIAKDNTADQNARMFLAECQLALDRPADCAASVVDHLQRVPSPAPGIVQWGLRLLESSWHKPAGRAAAAAALGELERRLADNADIAHAMQMLRSQR